MPIDTYLEVVEFNLVIILPPATIVFQVLFRIKPFTIFDDFSATKLMSKT